MDLLGELDKKENPDEGSNRQSESERTWVWGRETGKIVDRKLASPHVIKSLLW